LIAEARVEVNGSVAEIGMRVDPDRDRVMVDGVGIRRSKERIYLAMNKPRGVLCSADDPEGRPTVYELLPKLPSRVHSMGRLDFNSEGLLLFTNDGDLTFQTTHPSKGVPREYHVKVQGRIPGKSMVRLRRGIRIGKRPAKFTKCRCLKDTRTNTWLEVTLAEGRNREVRRMFEAVGLNVLKLKRVKFGPIKLGRLKVGGTRPLTDAEVKALRDEDAGTCTKGRSGRSRSPLSETRN